MKIAVLSDAVLPTPMAGGHGLGRVVHQVATGLLERGHDVTLIACEQSSFNGKLVMPPGNGYAAENSFARATYRLNKTEHFDVIIDNSHLHALSRSFPHLPVLNVYHDVFQPYAPCPVLLSYGAQALMQDERFWSAPIIHNAVDPDDFEYSDEPDNYALYLGVLSDIKQPILAIEACAIAGIPLKMAGPVAAGMVFPITEYSNVEYMGPVMGKRRAKLLAHATVFLQLGFCESFGLTTLEAGVSGTPTVAWPTGGNLDTVKHNHNGFFVPMTGKNKARNVADAIDTALVHLPSKVQSQLCRDYVLEHFNLARQIDAYEKLAELVVRGGRW